MKKKEETRTGKSRSGVRSSTKRFGRAASSTSVGDRVASSKHGAGRTSVHGLASGSAAEDPRRMRAAALSSFSPSFILDKDGCIDVSHRLVSDEIWTPKQGRFFRAVMARVCVETRIIQPTAKSDDLPGELARAAKVHRSYYFRFLRMMGPVPGEPVMAHHLFLRRPIYPGGAYPVDERDSVSGGSSMLALFESASDLDRRARLVGVDRDPDRSPVHRTGVLCTGPESCAQDRSPVNTTPSIFIEASQTERDRDDPDLHPSRSLGSLSETSSSCSLDLDQAVAPRAPGLATASQSTAKSQGADAKREGQKSRGSAAHAEAPGASDSDLRAANAVLRCWAALFARTLDHAFSAAWTALILTQLRRGLQPWELIAILSVTAKNPWHRAFPQREELDILFGREDWMAKNLSRHRPGVVRRLCAEYGVVPPPPPKDAPTRRIGAAIDHPPNGKNDQGARGGLDNTEQANHASVEESLRALNNFDVSYGTSFVPRPGGSERQ
jgi:hypothetical protein